MNENNVFLQSEKSFPEPRNNNSNGNNCNGHHQSIRAGGNGHYSGDGCDCAPTVSIDGYLWVLLIIGIILIFNKLKINRDEKRKVLYRFEQVFRE